MVLVLGRVRARVAIIQRALERYGVRTSTLPLRSSTSGLWRLGARVPHAIVVELPPAVTAAHVEVLLRLRDRWEQVPQIVVTSSATPSVLTSLLAVGVDDFVLSNGAWAELMVRLRRQLRRVAPGVPAMTAGPDAMQLDATRRTVTANGHRAALTSREFDVFRCLVDDGGTTLSREEILRRVWTDTDDRPASPGIIGVYILYLRRKLTKLGLAHTLHTVKGEGYCFQPPSDDWAATEPSAATARGARPGDLHAASAPAGRARDRDGDVAAEAKQNANKPVRRKAL